MYMYVSKKFKVRHNPYTQVPAVHIVGDLVWFHTEFMMRHLPYMPKMIERKQLEQVIEYRRQYLDKRSQSLTR